MYLGPDFFTRYNDFNFDPSTSTSTIRKNKGSMSCYPNPFDSQTKIEFELFSRSKVVIDVYTLSGQKICKLVNDEYPAGIHSVMWNARNKASASFEPGVYVCHMQLDDQQTASFQIQLLK